MRIKTLVAWCLMVCIPVSMWAQSGESSPAPAQETKLMGEGHSGDVKKQIERRGIGARTKVTLRDKTELKGSISRIDEDSFQLIDKKSGSVTTISFADVARVRGAGMSKGAKIATAAGVVAGVVALGIVISLWHSGE